VLLASGGGQFNQAEEAIRDGARVLILDARSSGDGAGIEAYAHKNHVKVIDYDWLSAGGSADYYVSFDSLKIGLLQGEGLISCASAWDVKRPRVLVMQGDSSDDYNVPVYVQGAMAVLGRQSPAGWQEVVDQQGTWTPSVALSDFEQEYAADRDIGAVLFANDENGEPIIKHLQEQGLKPRTLPTVGLDATTQALQYIVAGYECGTVYKPVYLEVQAAVALALYVRAGQPFPDLLSQSVTDEENIRPVRSVLLTPEWVTAQNMRATVIADGIRDKSLALSDVCTEAYSAACTAAGISS
jgi:D-xylose transport system substrate-binding protein